MNLRKMGILVVALGALALSVTGCAGSTEPKEEAQQTVEANVESEAAEQVATNAENSEFAKYFVDAKWLSENLEKENLVIVDARGEDAYGKGHVKGAVAATWQGLSNMTVDFATEGWGSVVDKEALANGIKNLGITKDSEVVVYCDAVNGWGEDGRILWSLKIAGIDNVKMLDGGFNNWSEVGFEVTTDKTEINPSDFEIAELNLTKSISTKELSENLFDYKIIDTRDLDEYQGEIKYGEARGGHLPGAMWISFKDLLNTNGTLKDITELESIFVEAGLNKEDKIVTYCTAGIRSGYMAVVLEMLGYENALNYDESFYVWANTPELKIGKVVDGTSFNYYTADQLKAAIESKDEFNLIDIQVEDEFDAHHIIGAVETNAYPVKSEEDKAKLEVILDQMKETDKSIVIVCPKGGGGAERTFNYFRDNGVNPSKLYILENGQAGWKFDELLDK